MQLDQRLKDILTPTAFEILRLSTAYTVLLAEEMMQNSGISEFLKTGNKTVMQVLKGMGYKPYALPALSWLLNFHSENANMDRNLSAAQTTYRKWTRQSITAELLAMDNGIQPFLEYLSFIAEDYPKFFTGEKTGAEIVFSEGRMKYWQFYFANEFCTYKTINSFYGTVVGHQLAKRASPFRVLEIGAGTGGGTSALFSALKEVGAAEKVRKYIFTDVSTGFLKTAETLLQSAMPRMEYDIRRLDINEPLAAQAVEPESVEVVYSLNCIHVAKDLVGALRQIYDSLVPGGQLCMGEIVRGEGKSALSDEMIFSLLSTYTDVRLKPGLRPVFGFLSAEHWRLCLSEAGFSKVEIVTTSEAGGRPDVTEAAAVIIGWK